MSSETFKGIDIFNCCFKSSTTDENKHICKSCSTAVKCDIGKNGYSNLKTCQNEYLIKLFKTKLNQNKLSYL